MAEMTDPYQWQGRTMVGSDGEKIGKIAEIYEDPTTGAPEWATVSSGLFGTRSNFVPLAGATPAGEDVRARVTKDQVKDAPGVERDDELSEREERRLFDHYGVPYAAAGSSSSSQNEPDRDQRPAGDDARRDPRAGERDPGPARLRRYVVTEQVIMAVPVTREEVRVEREPAGEGGNGEALDGRGASGGAQPRVDDTHSGDRRP